MTVMAVGAMALSGWACPAAGVRSAGPPGMPGPCMKSGAPWLPLGRQAGGGRRPGRAERRASVSGLKHCGRGVGPGAGIEVEDCARVSAQLAARFKAAAAR
jgi:hypothetical protein